MLTFQYYDDSSTDSLYLMYTCIYAYALVQTLTLTIKAWDDDGGGVNQEIAVFTQNIARTANSEKQPVIENEENGIRV